MAMEIECKDLQKSYRGDGVTTYAVRGVNVTFKKGKCTAVVGPSGSDEITLLSVIACESEWLLANDPTGSLDTETEKQIFDFMKTLNKEKGYGILFVTHEPRLTAKEDRMIEREDGSILSDSLEVLV